MLNNISLKWKGAIILIVVTLGMLIQGYISVTKMREVMIQEKEIKLQEVVDTALDTIAHIHSLSKDGSLTEEAAKKHAENIIKSIRYNDKNDYIFVYDFNGIDMLASADTPLEQRNKINVKDPDGVLVIKELIDLAKAGGGFLPYRWERDGEKVPKISYSTTFSPWGWMVGTGIYIDDVDEAYYLQAKKTAITILVSLLIMAAIVFYVISNIIQPILATSRQMTGIANEEPTEITGTNRKDEMGAMARTLENLKKSVEKQRELERELAAQEARKMEEHKKTMNDVANRLEDQVGSVVGAVEKAASDLQHMASALSAASEETTQQSAAVSSASESASLNVQTVASAAEELSSSIQELVRSVSDTAKATKICAEAAQESETHLQGLQTSVDEIDGVIQAINDVAEQTNLLALNATIEAARAGDAGKGFAVVANEVKSLAGETNKMTEEIAKKVEDIKVSAANTIASVQDILKQITAVDERTAGVSAAIEEQNSSTKEISRSAQEAARGTNEVSDSIGQVQEAANDTASSTEQLKLASDDLANQADSLKTAVTGFVTEIRDV